VKANEVHNEDDFFSIPFHIFMAGNLSFFSMCLGKGSAATSCYLCDLTVTKWKPHDHVKGTLWTLGRLFEMTKQLTDRRLIVDGMKRVPLITTLEVD